MNLLKFLKFCRFRGNIYSGRFYQTIRGGGGGGGGVINSVFEILREICFIKSYHNYLFAFLGNIF
jgi:hypothetical protein